MRVPSRRELFEKSRNRTAATLETAAALRTQADRILEATVAQRILNRELRQSMEDLRRSMQIACRETSRLTGTALSGAPHLPHP